MPEFGTVVRSGSKGFAFVRPDSNSDRSVQIGNMDNATVYINMADTCYVFAVDGDLVFSREPMFGARPLHLPRVGDRVIMDIAKNERGRYAQFWVYVDSLRRAQERIIASKTQSSQYSTAVLVMAQA